MEERQTQAGGHMKGEEGPRGITASADNQLKPGPASNCRLLEDAGREGGGSATRLRDTNLNSEIGASPSSRGPLQGPRGTQVAL